MGIVDRLPLWYRHQRRAVGGPKRRSRSEVSDGEEEVERNARHRVCRHRAANSRSVGVRLITVRLVRAVLIRTARHVHRCALRADASCDRPRERDAKRGDGRQPFEGMRKPEHHRMVLCPPPSANGAHLASVIQVTHSKGWIMVQSQGGATPTPALLGCGLEWVAECGMQPDLREVVAHERVDAF